MDEMEANGVLRLTKSGSEKRRRHYLSQLALGQPQAEALALLGVSFSTLDFWRQNFPKFVEAEKAIRAQTY